MNLPAKKYEIIALKDKGEEILEEIQLSASAEIISLKEEEGKNSQITEKKQNVELKLAEMRFAKNFLAPFAPKESFFSNLIGSFFPQKEKRTAEELTHLVSSGTMDELVKKADRLEKTINKINSQKETLIREIEELKKFSGLDIGSKQSFDNFNIFVGTIATDKKEELLDALKKESIFFFIKWGDLEETKRTGFYLIYPSEENFDQIAKSSGAKEESVFWSRLPAELLEEKRAKLEELKLKREKNIEEAKDLSTELPKLKALVDWYGWELDKYKSLEMGEHTETYFYLKAWIAAEEITHLEKNLKEITPHLMIKELPIEEGETPPVKMRNQNLMQSFETVTRVYGMPKPDEPDPTPFLAPFFAVAFGLALSDAGYGLLLIALSYLMGKKLKDSKSFFDLFIISGISTVFAGLLTGTFFGTDIFAGLRFVDAVSDPIEVLYLVSIFGVVQIFIGLIVGLVWNYKQGDYNVAFGSKGGSIVFFLGLALFAFTQNTAFALGGILLMMLLNIIFSEADSIIKRIMGSFGSVYDLIGYFSDVLSYSRLLALGLATGIIAMTINMIAQIFMEMIPVAGLNIAVAGFVLIFGHVANLLINALSSFIHAARLQFVEFFSKFMEGGGRKLKPLSKEGRFIEIIKK
jgi:V/A-type H+-transporting ATPase subunit I